MLSEKVDDSFPGTRGKPLATGSNSFDDWQRRIQKFFVKPRKQLVILRVVLMTIHQTLNKVRTKCNTLYEKWQ